MTDCRLVNGWTDCQGNRLGGELLPRDAVELSTRWSIKKTQQVPHDWGIYEVNSYLAMSFGD